MVTPAYHFSGYGTPARGTPHRTVRRYLVRVCLPAVVLLLAGCSQAQSKAKDLVKKQLSDPASAQFQNVVIAGDFVCGQVNSKNRMGGYNGFRRFYVNSTTSELTMDPLGTLSDDAIRLFGKQNLTPDLDSWAFSAAYGRICQSGRAS